MEALWIMLGGALTLVSGLALSLLNARISRDAQARQHGYDLEGQDRQQQHDAAMREQRHAAERQARHEEALRELLKKEAGPLYEFLELIDRDQGRRLLGGALREGGAQQRFEGALYGLDPSVKSRIDPLVWDNLSEIWEELVQADTQPEDRWQDAMKKYGPRFARIQDVELRNTLLELLFHLAGGPNGHLTESEVNTLVLRARANMGEAIVDPSSPYPAA